MQLIRGQKVKLTDLMHTLQFVIQVNIQSQFTTDVALFGLSEEHKLHDERYMIFYNQPVSPCQSLKLTDNHAQSSQFSINLTQLPHTIQKLMLTLSIDGHDVMQNLGKGSIKINDLTGKTLAQFNLDGAMFQQERAIMLVEFYQKDGIWRLNAVGQGFNGGLPALIEYFGGEVAKDEPPSNTQNSPSQSKIELKKKLSLEKAEKTGNQSIIDLTKKSLVQLEKHNLLDVQARVALVLDASGSMNWQYKNGDVQRIVNRLMPLAIHFDDDGQFECWAFANLTTQLDQVTLHNVNDFINQTQLGWKNWHVGSRINNEIPAIEAVIDYYYPQSTKSLSQKNVPVYVLFISDGGVGNRRQMEKILTECANVPIFWQFVGIGGSNYGVLEKLDDLKGRVVDNCNFFALDHIKSVSDERLYELLLEEFPQWLQAIQQRGII